MNVWLLIAAALLGYAVGCIVTRFAFFPKKAGKMIIACDKVDGEDYVFFETRYVPDQLRHHNLVCVEIVDKTEGR